MFLRQATLADDLADVETQPGSAWHVLGNVRALYPVSCNDLICRIEVRSWFVSSSSS